VFRTLEILGFEQAKDCYHLQYNFVELPDGAMSSRKGNIVPIMKLIHGMEKMIKDDYLVRYQDEWSQVDIDRTAEQVAQGAIKFGMIRIDNNKKIVFDLKEWLRLDGESGPFIQYSYARIQSLCEKFGGSSADAATAPQPRWVLLQHVTEKRLACHLMHFNSTVGAAALAYKPAILCTYLYELAKKFNIFYHECSVGNAESEELKLARLALCRATGSVLARGLEVLGIPAPKRM
jgi:arginyl-tRNA synthetase